MDFGEGVEAAWEVRNPALLARNIRQIGHYGTGDLEMTIKTEEDLLIAQPFIEKACQNLE